MVRHLPRVKAQLTLPAHRKVRSLLEGDYESIQLGRSMELNDLREYVRGDDVRDVEWKASARSGQLLVKQFEARRAHTVLLAVSTARTMAAVDDTLAPKRDLAVFVTGALGWLALRHGDRVAVVHGSTDGVRLHPPAGGEAALERALGAIHDTTTPGSGEPDVAALLEQASRLRRRTILVVVTDEHPVDEHLADALTRASVRHELLYVTIGDADPTRPRQATLADLATGSVVPGWVQADPVLLREYAEAVAAETAARRRTLGRLGIPYETVTDRRTALTSLHRLLRRPARARR